MVMTTPPRDTRIQERRPVIIPITKREAIIVLGKKLRIPPSISTSDPDILD
jgi:hypothetical protein